MIDMSELFLGLELVIVGMGITFLVLIILSSIIYGIGRRITKSEEKKNKPPEEEITQIQTEEIINSTEEKNDEETLAMIAAAYLHCFNSKIPLISLSKSNENWKLGGRREMMEGS
ncbi:MAG: Oxaloacetate decarboxylase, gamma chain [Candidatus Methanofastidiosum methylothiophilum]|uniref:Oxaloacetate decarboxylase, gamma chain n=1 Tax=Candidatus Methanofastidiosum methylothiophilum TaxID=1705564 RepID=A0A150IPR9_9EURY|nr:MAG: Oxaloacetate decarboxylase, gamma chain [Candidatus Methanofastidiosum methylthiophilus]KYC46950.1 MAG: Oxaloacetate decarboxylase, gamma chain [Candidatus Methanofastidiosum methylthiophilus]KYC49181.1 MAG: Oxaloacetate decarboxylase, gamma chain [Candidatus Methanofastidiosum methylthiophilus]